MSTNAVLKTIIAEAGGDPKAMIPVAAVILNRAAKEGKTPDQIVKAKGQFEGYSNPGSVVGKQLNDPTLLNRAASILAGVQAGAIADPTNGATMYHAASITPYWAKAANTNGTVNIGGNVFYKGNGALSAINQAAPEPASTPSTIANAYSAQSSGLPSNPTHGQISLGQDGQHYQYVQLTGGNGGSPDASGKLATWGWSRATADQNGQPFPPSIIPSFQNLPAAAMNGVSKLPGTVDSSQMQMTPGQSYYSPNGPGGVVDDTNLMSIGEPQASILPNAAIRAGANMTGYAAPSGLIDRPVQTVPIDPMTGNPIASRETSPVQAAAQVQQPQSLQDALNAYAVQLAAQQSGAVKTTSQAGNVALPPGIVPQSAANDLAGIKVQQGAQMAQPVLPKPFQQPSSSILGGANLAQGALSSIIPSANGSSSAYKDPSQLPTSSPGMPPILPQSAPTTQYTYQQMQVANPAYAAYIAAQNADQIGAGPGSFASLGSLNTPSAAPPQFMTQTIRVPVETGVQASGPVLGSLLAAAQKSAPAPVRSNPILDAGSFDASGVWHNPLKTSNSV